MTDRTLLLRAMVCRAIQGGATTFDAILQRCDGLYPEELHSIARELAASGDILDKNGVYTTTASTRVPQIDSAEAPKRIGQLIEPHPHDYDWRFSRATTELMTEDILTTHPGGTALLLGAPSIYLALQARNGGSRAILIDWSRELIELLSHHTTTGFQAVEKDLLSPPPWHPASDIHTVLCDPPWYPEYYAAFIAQAAYAANIGARIHVSLLPLNTRPSAPSDRWKVFETARHVGLDPLSLRHGVLEYESPPFEVASLRTLGINAPPQWRRADWVAFRKIAEPDAAVVDEMIRAADRDSTDRTGWYEISVSSRHKVKLRGPIGDHHERPVLQRIEEVEDTLPTVSRRYVQGRQRIDLWLWDNRVFGATGKAAIWAALHDRAGRPMPASLSDVSERNRAEAREILNKILPSSDMTSAPSRPL